VFDWIHANPGRLYVVGTLLPLAAFALLLAAGGVRALCRPFRKDGGFGASLYWAFGGDNPLKGGAYLATAFMACSAALGVTGLVVFLNDHTTGAEHAARWGERTDWIRIGPLESWAPPVWEKEHEADPSRLTPPTALALEVGYRIDQLTAALFAMVTVVGTLIFVFSLGYMRDETQPTVEDHEVDRQKPQRPPTPTAHLDPRPHEEAGGHGGHFHRRGRFGRFFLFLSLFCFSMLNLVIADNLFQVFVSWELVGVCSFFLIGFYYERPSASLAANKAFIVNRIGDAGFLVGIVIAWSYFGTLNIEEMARRARSPGRDAHGALALKDQLVRVDPTGGRSESVAVEYALPRKDAPPGSALALFPISHAGHFDGLKPGGHRGGKFFAPATQTITDYGAIPYWLFIVMGLGIFLGCVGKSAQVPLHTWLPDAMEGPTPVSALIHAATMVAAGVYLVGRVYPLFAPEVLLAIAYIGGITLFISASIALVQADIKRVLAYSTCSQLGYMMLALGVGGWVAGLLHLLTHAFFKALLFLCSGSVIYGCHHEQDLRKMGGLKAKMPVTAFAMLVGVLAISGAPLFSGWYSKDMVLASSLAFVSVHPEHFLLFVLPAVTAGLTAYYMFRLWFLAFTGPPRDRHVYDHARESPAVMTIPLVVLAAFSIGVAWGWPAWEPEASALGRVLHEAEPASVGVTFVAERVKVHDVHHYAGIGALLLAVAGAAGAFAAFYRKQPAREALYATGPPWYAFLLGKWYFDEAYDAVFVKPTVELAHLAAAADKRPTETPHGLAAGAEPPARRFDFFTLDGILNALGQGAAALGGVLRQAQTGWLRGYVAALALTAAALLAMLAALAK
jgi:NADH-quinone oxidoreductase subunit L